MLKSQHPNNNDVLGAPKDWDQAVLPCSALPITRCTIGNNKEEQLPAIMSYWKPSAEELVQLSKGALVCLIVLGESMPPVTIGVED